MTSAERVKTGRGGLAFWETQGQPAAFGPAEASELLSFLREHSGQRVRIEVSDWIASGQKALMRCYQFVPPPTERSPA